MSNTWQARSLMKDHLFQKALHQVAKFFRILVPLMAVSLEHLAKDAHVLEVIFAS